MSDSQIVNENGKPATVETRSNRRAQWAEEARGTRENMRGNFWVQKRADLVNEAEAILEKAQVQGRELTDGESRWFDKVKSDIDFVTGRVDAYHEARDAELAKAGVLPSRNGEEQGGLLPAEGHRARLSHLQKTSGAAGRRYADLFPTADDTGGFRSGEEFLRLVASGLSDERILKMNAATQIESVPSLGGYVVPEVLSRQWLDSSLESEIVRPRARVFPMTSETLKIGGFDVSDLSTSSPAGLRAEWAEENSTAAPQVGKFRIVGLKAHKLRLYTEASNELVADGLDFESQFGQKMVEGLSWNLDDAFLSSGTGAGQPLSILNDPSLVVVTKEGGQGAGTILYENIVRMFARLHPSAIQGATWVASSTTIPQLLSLYIGTGTSGTIMPAVKEGSGNFTLLGMPLLFTEKLPPLGTKGDILLVNFSNYAIGLRKEVVLEKSNAPGWSRDVTSYRIILRADGMGLWNKAQTPKNGDSRSWAVALATR
jgi:HK97 family phage major capsid protein